MTRGDDLSTVHEPWRLHLLPAAERPRWQALWADVDDLQRGLR